MSLFANFKLQLLLVASLSVAITGCVKDKTLSPDHCYQFRDFPRDYEFVGTDTIGFSYPSFNPNNPEEFCVVTKISSDSSGIFIYNMSTHILKPVYMGQIWECPKWGKKDWIVFGAYNQLYKVKSDGSNLMKITFHDQNYNPEWSADGENIIFRKVQQSPLPIYSVYVINSVNQIVDSLPGVSFGRGSWGDNNMIVTKTHPSSREIQFLSTNPLAVLKSIPMLPEVNDFFSIKDVDWIPNTNKVIWSYEQGLYITDYETEITTLIHKGCESHSHGFSSISSDGEKILSSTHIWRQNDNNKTVDAYSEIYVINSDGSGERRILPPQ